MILIAVDSRTIRMQIERLCAQDGLRALCAETLFEARAAFAENPVTAVVLDDWFRDGRGSELLEEIRASAVDHLPVISIGSERGNPSDANPQAQPDVRIAKADLVSRLPDELRTQLRAHAKETKLARILVIDDSLTYREQLRASLSEAGYAVLTAATGEEGVRLAFEHPPDALLVDSMLPGINGAAVVRRIRAESATRRTPCLLLTASEDPAQELEALEAGADTFVRKDEATDVILARLAGILRSASTPAAASLAALPQLPRRVVLIGQSPGPLDLVGTVLLEEGCETVSLAPGQVTLARCSILQPDILVYAAPVDEPMLAFCRDFKNLPGLRNSRLVLLDTAGGGTAAVAAIGAGADDYLPASSDHAIILARAKSQLRRKRMEDENRGLREHIIRQELETEAQRTLAEARSRHADEMRVAYGLAQQKAHEAERARLELEQITESIPQIVWTSDSEGKTVRFNGRWTDYTGLPREVFPDGIWRRAVHREDLARALREWSTAFREGLPYTSENRLRSAGGEYRWFLVRALPLADETGRIDRWFGTCTDIHDQKLSEEALRRTEKLAATGRLAASIAHEINNPLEAVTNLLYLIEQNTRDSTDTHAYVITAQKELDRVAQISKKTLAFYRESSNPAPVDLCELVAEVGEIYSVRLERKQIELRLERDCQVKPQGLAGELRQVISNLVTNAIEASPAESVIRVRIRPARRWRPAYDGQPPERGVRISIGDHGHGIAAALQPEIFKPFITTKGHKGTGLGLWLSHSIIRRHGGDLRLRSAVAGKPGKVHGTCFSVFLPLELTAAPGAADSMGTMLRTIGKELLGE